MRIGGWLVLLADRERRCSFTLWGGAETGRVLASEREREVAVLGRTFDTKEQHKGRQISVWWFIVYVTNRKLHRQLLLGNNAHETTCTGDDYTLDLHVVACTRLLLLLCTMYVQQVAARTSTA